MKSTPFFLTHGGMIDGVAIAAGGQIANVETPDGVDPIKAVRAIVNGLATATPPATQAAPQGQPEAAPVKVERTKFPAP